MTATHAIMVGRGQQKTPAAVAGLQIDYDVFRQMFLNETNKCTPGTSSCRYPQVKVMVRLRDPAL